MSVLADRWTEVAAVRGGLARNRPADHAIWGDRLEGDRRRAVMNQTPELAAITAEVERRSRALGADAVVLSGSTARGRRTWVSDLDYHVIGARPDLTDLPEEIDLYTDTPGEFLRKLRAGDDFVHWSAWFGCILFDSGVVRESATLIAEGDLWPDVDRKARQARKTLAFADQLVRSADHEAALEQTRGALSLTARWWLLKHEVFPLARDELSEQLRATGQTHLAECLHLAIHTTPSIPRLSGMLQTARHLLPCYTA